MPLRILYSVFIENISRLQSKHIAIRYMNMKKTLILLITIISLLPVVTACGGAGPAPSPTPWRYDVNENAIRQETINGVEYIPTCENDDPTQREINAKLANNIKSVTIDRLVNPYRLRTLEENGIILTLKKVAKQDYDTLILTFDITNSRGKTLTVDMPALMRYSLDDYIIDDKYQMDGFEMRWGNINVYKDELLVMKTKSVEFYNATTFEKLDKTMDFSQVENNEYFHIFDVLPGDNQYLAAYFGRNPDEYHRSYIAFYNKDLELVDTKYTEGLMWTTGGGNKHNYPYRIGEMYALQWLDKEQRYAVDSRDAAINNNKSFINRIYDAENMETFRDPAMETWQSGDITVDLIGTNYKFVTMTDYFAIRREKGRITHFYTFKQEKFPQLQSTKDFGLPVFRDDGMVLDFYNEELGIAATIDFAKSDMQLKSGPEGLKTVLWNEYVRQPIPLVNNGDCRLISTLAWFRLYDQWVYLYNYTTDKTVFLGEFEPKWMSGDAIKEGGFLPDGNVYICGMTDYVTYSRSTGRQLFSLKEAMSAWRGEIEIEDLRRDPVDGTFLVLYYKDRYTDKSQAILDHVDTQGRLLNRYPLDKQYFPGNTDMELIGTHTVSFYTYAYMYGTYTRTELDLQTRQFTVLEDRRREIARGLG